jgi:iron complex transport system permease protein
MSSSARLRWGTGLAVALLCGFVLYGVAVGPTAISVTQTVQAVLIRISPALAGLLTNDLAPWQQTVIWQVRIPRVLTGALVGASLATSGAVLQGLFRNPLASPGILGVSSGAALGAALAIFFGLSTLYIWALPGFAIAGAALALGFVYGIAMQGGHAPIARLLLVGVACESLAGAMMSFILALALQQWEVGAAIVYWSIGSLDGRTWAHVLLIAPVFLAAQTMVMCYSRELDILLIGEVHAMSVGVEVPRVRFHLLAATAALTGTAVAVSGGIGFIGLVVPHIVRLVAGPHHRHLLPLCALTGAVVVVGADLLLRSMLTDSSIPVGALIAALGAPFFIFLLIRQKQALNL